LAICATSSGLHITVVSAIITDLATLNLPITTDLNFAQVVTPIIVIIITIITLFANVRLERVIAALFNLTVVVTSITLN
jgi:hypothetical protein